MLKKAALFFGIISLLLLSGCGGGDSSSGTPTLTPQEARGKSIFTLNCASCHATIPEIIIVGPSLAGIATRAGERVPGSDARMYIQTSILKPGAYLVEGFPESMPPDFGKRLSGEDFDALVAYLLTLK